MRSTIRCAVYSSCLTLLASPDSSGGGLGRARVVSRRQVLFSLFVQNSCFDPICLFVRIDAYQFGYMSGNGQSRLKSLKVRGREFNSQGALLFFRSTVFSFFLVMNRTSTVRGFTTKHLYSRA